MNNYAADGAIVELLVVLATLGLMAVMLLPALAKTGPDTLVFQCLNNLRQTQHGWLMYSADNNDRIVPTSGLAGGQGRQNRQARRLVDESI